MKVGDFLSSKHSSGVNIANVDVDISQKIVRKIQAKEAAELLLFQKDLP